MRILSHFSLIAEVQFSVDLYFESNGEKTGGSHLCTYVSKKINDFFLKYINAEYKISEVNFYYLRITQKCITP